MYKQFTGPFKSSYTQYKSINGENKNSLKIKQPITIPRNRF